MFQDDGHLAALVLFRERTETARCFGGQGEVYLPLSGIIGVTVLGGAAQVTARDNRSAIQDVPALPGFRRASCGSRLGTAGDEFRAWRQNTAMAAKSFRF